MNTLFRAVRLGQLADESLLARHLNDLNEYGQNLLHEAIAYNQVETAIRLIRKGINLNLGDQDGATPLHFAAAYRLSAVATELLERGANPNVVDKHGNSPLWTAAFNARGNYALVELLKKFGAVATVRNQYGKTPIDFAKQIDDAFLTKLLSG